MQLEEEKIPEESEYIRRKHDQQEKRKKFQLIDGKRLTHNWETNTTLLKMTMKRATKMIKILLITHKLRCYLRLRQAKILESPTNL